MYKFGIYLSVAQLTSAQQNGSKGRKNYWLPRYFKQRSVSILSENIRDFLTFSGGREGGHWPEIG